MLVKYLLKPMRWMKLVSSFSLGALFYSPVDFTDASDLHQSVQV